MIQSIPHLYDVAALHKILHRRLFLPNNLVNSIIRAFKFIRNPEQSAMRKAASQSIDMDRDAIGELTTYGYAPFASENPEMMDAALAEALDCFQDKRNAGALEVLRDTANKEFLVTVLRDAEFLERPNIFRFIVSRPIVDLATAYFGCVPLLSTARLWWSPVNETAARSQRFHTDEEDNRQLKLFINVIPCSEATGPLTLIRANESDRLRELLRHRIGRVDDREIAAVGMREQPIVVTGPPGSGAWVDTSRCLHYGSRGNSADRLVLMVQFTNHLAPNINFTRWYRGLEPWVRELDGIQRLALGVR